MNLVLNIIIIILEAIYYALFIKFAKKQGNILKLTLLFILLNIILVFIGNNILTSYLIFVILMLIGLKYIAKVNVKIYDILFLFIIMIFKLFVEVILVFMLCNFTKDNYIMATLLGIFKIPLLLVFKNKINLLYNKIENYWNKNVFFIRYIFTILMFIYVIVSCVFIIFNK